MGLTVERNFTSRKQADLAVERLVQEHGFERTDIFVSAKGDGNSAGETPGDNGADNEPISVSIDLEDESQAALVKDVFDEIDAQ